LLILFIWAMVSPGLRKKRREKKLRRKNQKVPLNKNSDEKG